jgi:hypothetical protein
MKRAIKILGVLAIFAGLLTACHTDTAPPIRAAVYYPWFPGAWTQQGTYPYSEYTPSQGFYSSTDQANVRNQISAMQYANLDAGLISWWGQGSQEDAVVPTDLAAAFNTGFKWGIYYEPEGYSDPSVAQIESDMAYIKAQYTDTVLGDYLWVNGKPDITVYGGANDGCAMATRWAQANASPSGGFHVTLKVFPGYTGCADQPNGGWHQYGPASAEDHQSGQSFSISPGFFKVGETAPRLARNIATWTQNVKDMVASNEPLQLVTTWNEWGEGSATEGATDWSSASGYGQYVDVMHQYIPARSAPPPPPTTTTTGPTGSTTTTTKPPPPPTTTTTKPPPPPTTTTTQPSTGGHKVIVIPEENHSQSEFYAGLPYLAGLASTYGQATDYHAIGHPSLPNYLAIFGGTTYGTSSDCGIGCGPGSTGSSVWDQTLAAGKSAKAYQEGMSTNCASGGGNAYAPRHGPWPYWTNATSHANCLANDVPLTALQADISAGRLPVTGEITPNLNDDWHDGSAAQANTFLQSWVPKLMAGPDYTSGNLTIVVVADEDDGSQGNVVPFVVVDKALSHKVVGGAFTHYSLTRWLETNAGVPFQNNAVGAADLKSAFGL